MLWHCIRILIVVYACVHHTVLTCSCTTSLSWSIVVIGCGASLYLRLGLVIHWFVPRVAFLHDGLLRDIGVEVLVVYYIFLLIRDGWNLLVENAVCHGLLVEVFLRINLAPFSVGKSFLSSRKVILCQY